MTRTAAERTPSHPPGLPLQRREAGSGSGCLCPRHPPHPRARPRRAVGAVSAGDIVGARDASQRARRGRWRPACSRGRKHARRATRAAGPRLPVPRRRPLRRAADAPDRSGGSRRLSRRRSVLRGRVPPPAGIEIRRNRFYGGNRPHHVDGFDIDLRAGWLLDEVLDRVERGQHDWGFALGPGLSRPRAPPGREVRHQQVSLLPDNRATAFAPTS